ncbi:membrane-spanning 4-domains subfamily A member 4A-like isoform X1 [Tachysurus ichikawai]
MAPATAHFRCFAFLKGEPKAVGTVQIMIGSLTFLLGIVLTSLVSYPWPSVFISSGALSVATAKNHNPCMVNASLGMNVFSAVVAGVFIVLFLLDTSFWLSYFDWCENDYYFNHNSSSRCQRHVQTMVCISFYLSPNHMIFFLLALTFPATHMLSNLY